MNRMFENIIKVSNSVTQNMQSQEGSFEDVDQFSIGGEVLPCDNMAQFIIIRSEGKTIFQQQQYKHEKFSK